MQVANEQREMLTRWAQCYPSVTAISGYIITVGRKSQQFHVDPTYRLLLPLRMDSWLLVGMSLIGAAPVIPVLKD